MFTKLKILIRYKDFQFALLIAPAKVFQKSCGKHFFDNESKIGTRYMLKKIIENASIS